jgi:NhaA family Na+:H+ antiporter
VRSTDVYVVLGVLLWVAVFKSGIHATIAGVVLAALTPSKPYFTHRTFEASAMDLLVTYRHARDRGEPEGAAQALGQLEELTRGTESPLDRLEHTLHPWVSYLIVPLFALANAGVVLSGDVVRESAESAVSIGVFLGLVVGKPLGILLACFLMVRLRFAELPSNAGFRHMVGIGMLAGIGFTVSLFITGLAFDDPGVVDLGKIGILAGSAVAGVIGFVYLWVLPGQPAEEPGDLAESGDLEPALT